MLLACNPSAGEVRQEDPWGFLAASLGELVSSRFSKTLSQRLTMDGAQ